MTKSIVCYPVSNREDKIIGVIEVLNKRNEDRFTVDDEKTMKVLALVFSAIFHKYNPISESSLIRRFSTPYDRENVLIGKSPFMNDLRKTILKVKDLDVPVLINGEAGVGKSLYAKIIHIEGKRGLKEFEIIECWQKENSVLEKELFGPPEEESKLIKCIGGSVVLEEISQLSLEHQARLLKVIKDGRLSESRVSLDVRFLVTTSDDLSEMVKDGLFNKELFEYINKAYIKIDSLRKRKEDIEHLANYFMRLDCQKQGLLLKNFSVNAISKLMGHDWPGNIQELRVLVERIVLYNPKIHIITELEMDGIAAPVFDVDAKSRVFGDLDFVADSDILLKDRLALVEKELIELEIKKSLGNKSKAAKKLGISREALRKKLILSDQIKNKLDQSLNHNKNSDIKKAA